MGLFDLFKKKPLVKKELVQVPKQETSINNTEQTASAIKQNQSVSQEADLSSQLENCMRGIQQGLCDGFYAQNTEIMNGFHDMASNTCTIQNSIQHQHIVNLEIETHNDSATYWEDKFKEIKRLTQKSYPSKRGLKIPEIMILDYAESFNTDTKDFQSFWYYQYGLDNVQSVLNILLQKKFIQIAPAQETIKRFTVARIKELLKELGLKQTGRKAELLERLFTNASSEYLESKVTEKGFVLTDTGTQELKENGYVMYFHRFNGFVSINFDVWQMNKRLHDNPDKTYREIMWEDLQKQYNIALHEIQIKGYWQYTAVCNDICTFLLESKGNAETALMYFAEASYYEVNCNMLRRYTNHMESYKIRLKVSEQQSLEFTETQPEMYDCVYIDVKSYDKIQKELNISDNELCNRLDNIFLGFRVKKTLLSDTDIAKFIIAKVKKDYEMLDKMKYIIDDSAIVSDTFN